MSMEPIEFIKAIRSTDFYIEHIFLEGGCFRFYMLLKKLYPDATPWINVNHTHVGTMTKGKLYDIRGRIKDQKYFSPMTRSDIEKAKKWSFHKQNLIKITECPYCEEPLTYKA